MLNYQMAIKLLRPVNKESPTLKDIENAYVKMIQRYPSTLFPDKFREIRKAYEFLTNSDDFWKETIESEHPDVSFLANDLMSSDLTNSSLLESDQEFLTITMAPFLKRVVYRNFPEDGGEES